MVSILFAIVLVYGNEYMTKEHKNWTGFKNKFKPQHIPFKVALDTKSWEVELIQTFSVEREWNKIPLEIKSGSNYNLEEGGIEREGWRSLTRLKWWLETECSERWSHFGVMTSKLASPISLETICLQLKDVNKMPTD